MRVPKRLPMRLWIKEKLDNCEYPGMRWLNRQEGKFEVSWTHGSRQNWSKERDSKVFKEWAVYTGKFKPGEQQVDGELAKRWKTNFRCALNSLPEIELVREESEGRGARARKVYRMKHDKVMKTKTRQMKETRKRLKTDLAPLDRHIIEIVDQMEDDFSWTPLVIKHTTEQAELDGMAQIRDLLQKGKNKNRPVEEHSLSDAAINTMQALRIGSSKGNEVATRLNAYEDNLLQKEMHRFQKEHDMVLKQFYNERYTVRQTMYDLRMSKKRSTHQKYCTYDKTTVNNWQPRKLRLERRTSQRNNVCTQNGWQKNGTKPPDQDCDQRTRNPRTRVRSLSVPNLSLRKMEVGHNLAKNSFDLEPGQFDPNANTEKGQSVAASQGWIRKTCRWMNMEESVNGIKHLGIDCSVEDNESILPQQTRPRSRSEAADLEYQHQKRTKQVIQGLTVRPKTFQSTGRCSGRKTFQIQDETTELIQNRDLMRGGNRPIHNEVNNSIGSRPLYSPVTARFLCVSEAVLAAQKLINSYRRQQAIEKNTEELQATRMTSPKKTRENEPVKRSKWKDNT